MKLPRFLVTALGHDPAINDPFLYSLENDPYARKWPHGVYRTKKDRFNYVNEDSPGGGTESRRAIDGMSLPSERSENPVSSDLGGGGAEGGKIVFDGEYYDRPSGHQEGPGGAEIFQSGRDHRLDVDKDEANIFFLNDKTVSDVQREQLASAHGFMNRHQSKQPRLMRRVRDTDVYRW